MPTPSVEFDASWPEKLPTDGTIQAVFDRVYGYEMIGAIDDPWHRVKIVQDTLINNFQSLTMGLHETLTNQFDDNRPELTGRQTSKAASRDDPLILFHGLDREQDIAVKVLPQIQIMFDILMLSGEGPQEVLDHMAAITGVLVAQSQSFSDGNTRIARAMHDFVRDGRQGLSAERIFDHSRNFVVPVEVEKMILIQNVTRMINGRYEGGEFYPATSKSVPDAVRTRLYRSAQFLSNVYGLRDDVGAPFDYDSYAPTAQLLEKLRRKSRMQERLANITTLDHELTPVVVTALRQREYGPAAWTVAFRNRELVSLPLSRADAQRLLEADRALLRMRIVSLAKGMEAGGIFDSLANAAGSTEFQSERLRWMPTATLS